MPLVRLELRNEYGIGNPEIYRAAVRREDPKAVLDGVAVSGLVGILRQLGDLAGFAAEVFRDLHEQISATSVRAHRMSSRIQHIESLLPSIEEAIQSQTSHIHFAYLPGSDWHADVQLEHDHLLCSDLPRFIMDSYEECRDPPRLFLLDKFDSAGAGACLKRYSDPTYFKRVCASAKMAEMDRVIKEKKAQKRKIKGLQTRNAELQHIISLSRHNNSIRFCSSGTDGQSTVAETLSASELKLKCDFGSRSASFDSRAGLSCAEPVPSMHSSAEPQESVDYEPIESILDVSNGDNCSSIMSDDFLQSNTFKESLQQQDPQFSGRWVVVTQVPKTTTKLSDMVIGEGVQNVGSQPAGFGKSEQDREDAKLEKPAKDIFFDIGNVFFEGPMLSEHDDQKSEVEKLNEDILDDEGNVSNQVNVLSQHHDGDYNVEELVEKNLINGGSMLHHGVLSPEQENKETVNEEPPENASAYNEALLRGTISSKMRRLEAENSDDVADTLRQEVIFSNSKNVGKSVLQNHFEEGTSEAENYVDALNAMDSETETESAHQKMQPRISSISSHPNDIGSHDTQEITTCISDSSKNDIIVLPRSCQSTFPDCISSQNSSSPESLLEAGVAFKEQHPLEDPHISCDSNRNGTSSQDIDCDQSSVDVSNSKNPSSNESQEICDVSDDPPIKIWTNACLFGVEPSKPPDFNVSVSTDWNSASIVQRDHPTEQPAPSDLSHDPSSVETKSILRPDDHISNDSCLVEKNGLHRSVCPQGVTSPANAEVGMLDSTKQPVDSVDSSAFCNDRIGKSRDYVDSVNDCLKSELDGISELPSGTVYPARCNVMAKDAASLGNKPSVSPLLVQHDESHVKPMLQSGFLGDTIQRKTLSNAENLPSPSKKLQQGCLPAQQTICPGKSIINRKIEAESSTKFSPSGSHLLCSSPPSPPLENMKISFHPMNGVANSKLKLEFPGGDLHKNIEELMFPSFELLSGSSVSQLHISSESDDDTFCRSSAYHSDNVVSPHSDTGSDSELWELEEEETRLEDVKLEDNISTAFQSSHSLDLPGLDSLKEKHCAPENVVLSGLCDLMLNPLLEQPPPPPLPPLQWRMTKTSLPMMSTSPQPSDEVSMKLDSQKVEQAPSQVLGQAAPLSPIDGEKAIYQSKSMIETQKLNGSTEVKATKSKDPVDTDNMLYQIRNRSASLRRTVTGKPTFLPETPTNVKVAAILEKANAIRQCCESLHFHRHMSEVMKGVMITGVMVETKPAWKGHACKALPAKLHLSSP